MASLTLSIGLIASLNRSEESTVPSWPLELTITPHPACHRGAEDASDKRTGLRSLLADADSVYIARHASVADVDIVIARGEILTG